MDILNHTNIKINTVFLQKAAAAAFAVLESQPDELSLVFVSDKKIREINNKYRQKDSVTDVLSFEDLNEIFICLPQAIKQSKLLKTPLNSELTRLLVHGILHLKGFDHERSKLADLGMKKIEENILRRIKI